MDYRGRKFLFLQGPASPFFNALGRRLRASGAETLRVNFCPGDALYWRGPAVPFAEDYRQLPGFYDTLLHTHGFTDIVLFGDTRALHRPVLAAAERRRARVHVFEEGYLRPSWITLERGGVNGHSPLPRDPDWYFCAARTAPSPELAVETRVTPAVRAMEDMAFQAANLAAPLLYPHYRTHRPRPPAVEYAGWALRFPQLPVREVFEARALREQLRAGKITFFLALQLPGDSQITQHSPYDDINHVLEDVIASFAGHADKEAHLVIKNHPLDTGLDRHGSAARRLAGIHGVRDRVHFFETGHLPTIAKHVSGTIVVNSTVGFAVLGYGCPVKTLADPIYHMPGLTFQGSLEEFWRNPTPPDRNLYRAFRHVLLAATQVNGNFFTPDGIRLAVQGCDRMFAEESPLEALKKQVGDSAASAMARS
jgi:capsular polysaccharide export protein